MIGRSTATSGKVNWPSTTPDPLPGGPTAGLYISE